MRNFKKENGQSLIEFALVLPILLSLVFSIIDFGMFFSAKNQLEMTSFSMARNISLGQYTTPLPRGITVTDPNTGLHLSNWILGQEITVNATAQYQALTPIIPLFFGSNLVTLLSPTTIMIEQLKSN